MNWAQALDKHFETKVLQSKFLDKDLVVLNPRRGPSTIAQH